MSRYRKTFTEAMQEVYLSEKEITKLKNGVKVLGNALPNRMVAQKAADKANKEMGHDADVYQSPFNNRFYVRIKEDIKEADDHEISMARGELEAISDKALKLSSILQGKTDKDQIEAWVQSKITKAKDYINSVADYMEYNPDMANEELDLQEGVGHISGFRNDKEKANMISLAKQHGLKVDDTGGKLKLSGNMRKILDMQLAAQGNGLKAEDFRVGISEGTMIGGIIKHAGQPSAEYQKARLQYKTFMSKPQQAKGAEDKVLKFIFDDELLDDLYVAAKKNPTMDVRDTVKKRLAKLGIKEENELEESFSDAQIAMLKKEYEPLRGKRISVDNANKLGAMFSKFDSNKNALEKLYGGNIPFVSQMAMTRLMTKHNYKAADLNKLRKESVTFAESMFELSVLEEFGLDEGTMSKIDQMQKDGMNATQIAKQLKLSVAVVKGILGEAVVPEKEEEEEEAKPEVKKEKTDDKEKLKAEIEKKDDEIAMLKTKAETEKAKVAKKETEKLVNPETGEPLLQVGIAYKHLKDKMKKEAVDKDGAYAIGMSAAKKKYNDEPPLDKKTITKGHEIAKSILKKEETIVEFTSQQIKMAYGVANDKRYKQGNYTGAVAAIEKIAKGLSKHPDVQKVLKRTNEQTEHPAKMKFEEIKGLRKKAEKSGMPYGILKKVYDRGMAAWRGGHRPGASQQQWAFARVNSFVTKSSGTWGGADKDLAAKVKGK